MGIVKYQRNLSNIGLSNTDVFDGLTTGTENES